MMVLISSCLLMLPAVRGQVDPVFDGPFVDRAIISAELSLLVKDASPANPDALVYTFFQVAQAGAGGGDSSSANNRALVAKNDGTCYVAYNARVPGLFEDLFQRLMEIFSFNLDFFDDVCFGNDCCNIRTPVQKAFSSLEGEVETLVDACRATCGGAATPCPLILTGHHQGS